ncbi:MAG: biotin/lipoyl-containing protein, partial [Solirubrobacteraceae bacterium]
MPTGTMIEVRMPEMGESVTEGTVLEWHKQEGDAVSAAETIVEISTDKVDAEVPSPVAGVIAKIHVAEGDTIGVGTLLAEITTNGAAAGNGAAGPAATNGSRATVDAPAPAAMGAAGGVADADADSGRAREQQSPAPDSTELVDVVTPAAGESVTEGTSLEWHRKVGERIERDETLVEISTDKVDVELPAPASGTVSEILVGEGDTVGVGQVIARLAVSPPGSVGSGTPAAAADGLAGTGADVPAAPAGAQGPLTAGAGPGPSADHQPAGSGAVSPVAARAAQAEGVDTATVAGSGPGGRVMKADVLAAAQAPGGEPVIAGAEPLRGAAAALARYMDASLAVPTATSFRTLVVSVLDARRRELKGAGHRVSFTHLIAYAIARAALAMPVMARHFAMIDGRAHGVDDGRVNLGLAVDVEGTDGSRTLLVPVLRDAGSMDFSAFVRAYDDLVERARVGGLSPDDLAGANITLTNPGGIGTVASVPRLMAGQGTIVATGAIGFPAGLGEAAEAIGAEKVMTMTSTYDHRVIQGAESGRFLATIDGMLAGADGFYEDVFAALGVPLGPLPAPPPSRLGAGAQAPPAQAVPPPAPSRELLKAVSAATALLKAFRTHGHLAAHLDPLGMEPEGDPSLDPEWVGLTQALMAEVPAELLETYVRGETLAEALPHLRDTYCGTIAYEIEHIASHRQRTWLREQIESGAFRGELGAEQKIALLKRLIEVDALERFMHKAYLGQHQFSIEGLDMTVPMLDELIRLAADGGAAKVVVGMAHRGRLNVLAHNLGRTYDTIFAEFEGASSIEADALEAVTTIPQGGTGDVKYHHGSRGQYELGDGR